MRSPRRTATVIGLVAAAALTGCALLGRAMQEPKGPLSVPFNHLVHGEKATLECANCHPKAATSDEAGMPRTRQCLLCHGEGVVPGEKRPYELELAALVEPVAWPRRNALPDSVRFSHAHHLEKAGLGCEACHGDTGRSLAVRTAEARVGEADCARCHTRRDLALDECSHCHVEGHDAERRPAGHGSDWIRRHGTAARSGFASAHGTDCATCHREETCAQCHRVMEPANHTQTWRERGHGLVAGLDRESCTSCHQQDSCQRCHEEVRPRSHRAGWGTTAERHCLSCHPGDLEGAGCAACHRGTPSHARATARPSWHVPGMNCRQCHGLAIRLPHPDNGQSCAGCHP